MNGQKQNENISWSVQNVFTWRHIGMLGSLKKGRAAMLVSPANPPGIKFYSYSNAFFCYGWKTFSLITWVKILYREHKTFKLKRSIGHTQNQSFLDYFFTNLKGNSTSLLILSLKRMFLNENLLRWIIRTSGRRHTESCLVASRCALQWGQYLQCISKQNKSKSVSWQSRLFGAYSAHRGHKCIHCRTYQASFSLSVSGSVKSSKQSSNEQLYDTENLIYRHNNYLQNKSDAKSVTGYCNQEFFF